MLIPEKGVARWLMQLDEVGLTEAHVLMGYEVADRTAAERRRRGANFVLLEGPGRLVNAWLRLRMVRQEIRARHEAVLGIL